MSNILAVVVAVTSTATIILLVRAWMRWQCQWTNVNSWLAQVDEESRIDRGAAPEQNERDDAVVSPPIEPGAGDNIE